MNVMPNCTVYVRAGQTCASEACIVPIVSR